MLVDQKVAIVWEIYKWVCKKTQVLSPNPMRIAMNFWAQIGLHEIRSDHIICNHLAKHPNKQYHVEFMGGPPRCGGTALTVTSVGLSRAP